MKKLVIFDKDGVMVDTEGYSFNAWKKTYTKFGYSIDLETYKSRGIARSRYEFIKFVTGSTDTNLHEKIHNYKEDLYHKYLSTKLKPVNGFIPFFNLIKKEFIVAIGSSGVKENIMNHIRGIGLITDKKNPFAVIISGFDVERTKPYPDVFLKVAEKTTVKKEECLVFEDSVSGVIAAKSAGMYCFAKESKFFERAELKDAGADFIFNDFLEIDISKLKYL